MTRRGVLCALLALVTGRRVLRVTWPEHHVALLPSPACAPDLTFRANARLCSLN